MKLEFCCQSQSPVCENARRALVENVGEMATITEAEADGDSQVSICFDVLCESDEAASLVDRVLDAIGEVSQRHDLDWSIGHQHEPHLGLLHGDQPEPGLRDGILTSLHVARTFGGMIVDDEFVGVGDEIEDEVLPADEAHWNELLEDADSFTPFPELDES